MKQIDTLDKMILRKRSLDKLEFRCVLRPWQIFHFCKKKKIIIYIFSFMTVFNIIRKRSQLYECICNFIFIHHINKVYLRYIGFVRKIVTARRRRGFRLSDDRPPVCLSVRLSCCPSVYVRKRTDKDNWSENVFIYLQTSQFKFEPIRLIIVKVMGKRVTVSR